MLIIGLTGSIGMGKSTAAARFKALGIDVFDADAEVHKLYEGPLAQDVERAFPGSTTDGKVDRGKLSAILLKEPDRLTELERIVHPRVRANERSFIAREHAKGAKMAVLEVPLLFEAGNDKVVDVIVVVSAHPDIQRKRVLERPGMSEAKLAELLSRQLDDKEKRARADFVVDTSGSVEACHAQIDDIVAELSTREGGAYARFWS
ncbi:MAG: dephospho-CoA kinase [Hyphomicrobiaceae bacterium]|nr:dephospho-CoA kinase [Hyphomicrobiaceae bacterium]